MKFHWGHGIILSFILFICFIGYYAIRIQTSPEQEHSLVIKNYYADELKTEALLTALKNGIPWRDSIQFEQDSNSLLFYNLPKNQAVSLNGYRASDATIDFKKNYSNLVDTIKLDRKVLVDGKWKFILEWEVHSKKYRVEKEIHFN